MPQGSEHSDPSDDLSDVAEIWRRFAERQAPPDRPARPPALDSLHSPLGASRASSSRSGLAWTAPIPDAHGEEEGRTPSPLPSPTPSRPSPSPNPSRPSPASGRGSARSSTLEGKGKERVPDSPPPLLSPGANAGAVPELFIVPPAPTASPGASPTASGVVGAASVASGAVGPGIHDVIPLSPGSSAPPMPSGSELPPPAPPPSEPPGGDGPAWAAAPSAGRLSPPASAVGPQSPVAASAAAPLPQSPGAAPASDVPPAPDRDSGGAEPEGEAEETATWWVCHRPGPGLTTSNGTYAAPFRSVAAALQVWGCRRVFMLRTDPSFPVPTLLRMHTLCHRCLFGDPSFFCH